MFGKIGSYLIKNNFKNSKKIGNLAMPVMLINGEKDKMVKMKHAKGLYGKLRRAV